MADPHELWVCDRRETIKEIRNLGEKILHHAKKAKIVRAAGGGTAVAASLAAAICYFAVPFTFGWTLAPATVLTAFAIGGGATSIGATVTKHFIENGYIGNVQEALNADSDSLDKLKKAVEKAKAITLEEGIQSTEKVGENIPGFPKLAKSVSCRLVISEMAATRLLRLGRTARFPGHVLAEVALQMDITSFVKDVVDLAKGNISDAAQRVMEMSEMLEKELEDVMVDARF